jgi:sugar lactone lactonase YvrE
MLPSNQTKSEKISEARNGAAEKATSDSQWTGVAVDKNGQKFVNYPRWSNETTTSVAKLDVESGKTQPFPNESWNSWKPGQPGDDQFICVQSVVVDASNHLWVLDTGHPDVAGMKGGTPKLVEFDPSTGEVLHKFPFPKDVAPDDSYLNDVRFDKDGKHAFMTDSILGGLVVLDLETGRSRRLLANHPSTKSEEPPDLTIEGKIWLKNGKKPRVQSDGIAVDKDTGDLYYHAMTSHSLYKVPIAVLLDEKSDDEALAKQFKLVMITPAPDGMEFGPDGYLYLTDLENNAIKRWKPGTEMKLQTVVQGPDLHWPDSIAFAPDGSLWFTTSQIHLGPHPQQPYGLWRIDPSVLNKAKK